LILGKAARQQVVISSAIHRGGGYEQTDNPLRDFQGLERDFNSLDAQYEAAHKGRPLWANSEAS